LILHIISRDDWAAAGAAGAVTAPSLADVGYVHCSDPGTAHLPANRLFAGRSDMLLAEIDPGRLGVPLRWEPGDGEDPAGPWFPHVYGPIPVSAVLAVHEFPSRPDGSFALPASLARYGAT
jgi:uncharacterized protein (DUF952 family)